MKGEARRGGTGNSLRHGWKEVQQQNGCLEDDVTDVDEQDPGRLRR